MEILVIRVVFLRLRPIAGAEFSIDGAAHKAFDPLEFPLAQADVDEFGFAGHAAYFLAAWNFTVRPRQQAPGRQWTWLRQQIEIVPRRQPGLDCGGFGFEERIVD